MALKRPKGKSLVNNIRYFDNGDTIDYIDKKAVSNGEFVLKKDDNGDVYISKT